MASHAETWFKREVCTHFALALLALMTVLPVRAAGAQDDNQPPHVGEGCLLYRSPISGRYDSVPLVHTDVALDVRGLVASATVTQQYVNSSTEPIEAVYIFPLPHDAAVYDMEIQIGNRVIRSTIRERQDAKRVYEAAKHGTVPISSKRLRRVSFLLAAYPPTVQPAERMPVEMLYMIDVSGSMTGTSIEQAREALLRALDRLRPCDRFGILKFSSGYGEFAAEPLPATSENLAAARDYVKHLEAGGGTEMLPALLHLMGKPEAPGYLRHIVLLTDGDLGNEEEIFAALRSDLGDARLYTVGIGSAPNVFLATKMAQFGRGTFTHIADRSEISEQMGRLFASIESPVLTDVNLSFANYSRTYDTELPLHVLQQSLQP